MLKHCVSIAILTLLMYVLLGLAVINWDAFDLPHTTLIEGPPDPHDEITGDPLAHGIALAHADIAKGEVRYFLYGLRYENPQDILQQAFSDVRFITVLRGCEVGGPEYERDEAYNFTVDAWLKNHYGRSVMDVMALGRPDLQ